jgi:G:T-mismatch repair DNA endonuclease (very short patch repair protein)
LNGTTTRNWWKNASIEEKEKKIRRQLQGLHKASSLGNKIELMMADALDQLKLPYKRFHFVERYISDFYIKSFNLIIECNGDFWHANPSKYQKNDVLKFPGTKGVIAEELWKKDERKIDKYKNIGYNVLVVWESDIRKLHKRGKLSEFLMDTIKNEIGLDKL